MIYCLYTLYGYKAENFCSHIFIEKDYTPTSTLINTVQYV